MPKQGLHLITPSAAVATGTGSSATINANGSVTFSTISSLQLQGVFSADYDNYQIVCRWQQSSLNGDITGQMVSGSTAISNNNYAYQTILASGATVNAARSTIQSSFYVTPAITQLRQAFILFVYGPYLAQSTVARSMGMDGSGGGRIYDTAWKYNVGDSYDGIKFSVNSGSGAGLISVYGMRK